MESEAMGPLAMFLSSQQFSSLQQIDFKRASGMIKFCTENCLSGLGHVMKEPQAI
jgi:hypothetical protein